MNSEYERMRERIWGTVCVNVIARCRKAIADNVWRQTRKSGRKPMQLALFGHTLDSVAALQVHQAREDYDG